jgi:hypothetical protein
MMETKSKSTAKSGEIMPFHDRKLPEVIDGIKSEEVLELVTRPTLRHEQGQVMYVRFLEPMVAKETGKTKVDPNTGEVKNAVINVAVVLERITGIEYDYVCNAVTASKLNDKYPMQAYVGKNFAIQKMRPSKGNQYCEIKIVRLRDEVF